jgi:Zn-finger nucleic acid-binding protein
MPCPIDGTQLVMSERQGIEIDYCPTCRGVWLDRGELDKIVERSANDAPAPVAQTASRSWPEQHSSGHYRHKRRKSFLEELFD